MQSVHMYVAEFQRPTSVSSKPWCRMYRGSPEVARRARRNHWHTRDFWRRCRRFDRRTERRTGGRDGSRQGTGDEQDKTEKEGDPGWSDYSVHGAVPQDTWFDAFTKCVTRCYNAASLLCLTTSRRTRHFPSVTEDSVLRARAHRRVLPGRSSSITCDASEVVSSISLWTNRTGDHPSTGNYLLPFNSDWFVSVAVWSTRATCLAVRLVGWFSLSFRTICRVSCSYDFLKDR